MMVASAGLSTFHAALTRTGLPPVLYAHEQKSQSAQKYKNTIIFSVYFYVVVIQLVLYNHIM